MNSPPRTPPAQIRGTPPRAPRVVRPRLIEAIPHDNLQIRLVFAKVLSPQRQELDEGHPLAKARKPLSKDLSEDLFED